MSEQWKYQLRIYFDDAHAELARRDPGNPALKPLGEILNRHQAALKSQLDSFADYVAEAEAKGVENYPLYKWTKVTLDDPEKRAKHARSFALRVGGEEVYDQAAADRLEADLRPLIGGPLITRLSKHDTNPANNMPVPDEFR